MTEVENIFPYGAPHKREEAAWYEVSRNFYQTLEPNRLSNKPNKDTIKRRVNDLLAKWRKEELESLRKSGTDEDYEEKEQILTDLTERIDNLQMEKEEDKEKKAVEQEKNVEESQFIINAAISKKKELGAIRRQY